MLASLGSVLGDLYARAPRGIRLGVEPMLRACARFGHPERVLSVVHVAGTNGKGSVSSMLESVARHAGLRTGLYTSPHLARFAERIRIGGVPIDDARLVTILGDVLTRERELSFFEAATLAALVAFREERVDLAVLEVGLGGRLDATNVVASPRACVVTRVALDHTEHLGTTLESIAREKASIAKPGCPLFLGVMPDDIARVVEDVAERRGATPVRAEHDLEARAFRDRAKLALEGEHQKDNALVAYAVATRLGFDRRIAEHGIEVATWPGRLERLTMTDGPVLFDAAHNPDGAAALASALAMSGATPDRTALLFGALADKDWRGMLDISRRAHRSAHTQVRRAGPPATRPSSRAATMVKCSTIPWLPTRVHVVPSARAASSSCAGRSRSLASSAQSSSVNERTPPSPSDRLARSSRARHPPHTHRDSTSKIEVDASPVRGHPPACPGHPAEWSEF